MYVSILSTVSGIHWGSWNIFPAYKKGLLHMYIYILNEILLSHKKEWSINTNEVQILPCRWVSKVIC